MPKSKTKRPARVNIQITPRRQTSRKSSRNSKSRTSLESQLQTSLVLSGSQVTRVNTRPMSLRLQGNLSPIQRRYLLALQTPFHPDAIGARVPDFNSRATAPFTLRWKLIVTIPAPSVGQVSSTTMILVPNPAVFGVISNNSSLASSTVGLATVEGSVTTPLVGSNGIYGVLLDVATSVKPIFSNQFSNFRVVAGGIRLANLAPLTNNQFVMNTYQTPCARNLIPYQQICGYTVKEWAGNVSLAQASDMLIGQSLTNNTTSALNLQSRRAYTGYEIQDSPLTLSFQPNNPSAHIFRSSDGLAYELGGTAAIYGDEVIVDSAGALVPTAGDSSLLSNTGWDGVITNLWQATSGVVLELEYVLHCEGTQSYNSGTGSESFGNSQNAPINPMFSLDSLIGMARQACDYAKTIPRVMNGMADLYRASGYDSRRYQNSRLNRLTYQTGEF